MKVFVLFFPLTLLFFPISSYAETVVTTGNATSTVSVNNSTDGGTVTTHIETDVNGDDKVLDTNGSGNITVEHDDKSYSVTTSPGLTIIPTATPSSASVHLNYFKNTSHHSFWTKLKTFFQNLFHFL